MNYQRYQHRGSPLDFYGNLSTFLRDCQPDALEMKQPFFRERSAWAGRMTLREAYEHCRKGNTVNPKAIEFRDRLLRQLRTVPKDEVVWDVCGSEFDVGAYLGNIPECALNFTPDVGKARKGLGLVLNIAVNCNVSADQMALMNAAYMALIDCLEASKLYAIRVYATCKTSTVYATHQTVIRIKDTQDRYDPNAMTFVLGHPAMLRQLVFAYIENGLADGSRSRALNLNAGYGRATGMSDLPHAIEDPSMGSTEPINPGTLSSEEDAYDWVIRQLSELNVQLEMSNQ